MRRNKFKSLGNFEALEDRRMMAGDISFSNHTLTINGTGADDVAHVRFEGNKVYVDISYQALDDGESETEVENTDKKISDVSRIVFNGFAGEDQLTAVVNTLSSGTTLNNIVLEFHGGDNDDQLINQLQSGVKIVAFGDAGNDILQGSKFNDTLEGGAGDDDLAGGTGDDKYVFSGLALGHDTINEPANIGLDTLDLTNFGQRVDVDLAATYVVVADSLSVKISDMSALENVIGTAYADVITGNARPNNLSGRGENDNLTGAGGDDTLDGGAGSDTFIFGGFNLGTDSIIEAANADTDTLDFSHMPRTATPGVTVDLTKSGTTFAVNSADLKLKLSNNTAIENVIGTNYSDKITGNSRSNDLRGGYGNDTISGGAGADYLYGGENDDLLLTDALDHAFGEYGRDVFDKFDEGNILNVLNPQSGRYMDWRLIDRTPEVASSDRHVVAT